MKWGGQEVAVVLVFRKTKQPFLFFMKGNNQ
jgi:hypothetical protein